VIVVGRNGAADPDRADDAIALNEWNAAPAEHERVVTQRGHVVGEEHPLAEALFQVERGGAEAGRRVGLGARDLRCHPERAVHALAGHQVPAVVDDSDRDLEAELLCALHAPSDTGPGLLERELVHPSSTRIWSPSMRTGYDGTAPPRVGKRHSPVRTSNRQPCHGHTTRVPDTMPSESGPFWCEHSALS